MKPISVTAYKPYPSPGQPLVRVWSESLKGLKVKCITEGYVLLGIFRQLDGQLVAKISSPFCKGLVLESTYYNLCKNFTWEGDNKQPIYYSGETE